VHWKIKALAQKMLWRFPAGVRLNSFVSHVLAGHDPQVELYQKHAGNFFRHVQDLKRAGVMSVFPARVLEIGTGWDLDVALFMSLAGAHEIITVDLFRHVRFAHVRRNLCLFEPLLPQIAEGAERDAAAIRAQWERFLQAETLEQLCHVAGIRYVAPVSAAYDEIADNSVDLCYSTAVFEHIRREDLRRILLAVRRKLRVGGCMSHVIDLKDHFAYFQHGLPYNHFLRFTTRQWEWWADNPMSYLNRMSPTDWKNLLRETGFDIVAFQMLAEQTLPFLPREKLHPQQHWPPEELPIGELRVIARPTKNSIT
jgi:hypothetical protein